MSSMSSNVPTSSALISLWATTRGSMWALVAPSVPSTFTVTTSFLTLVVLPTTADGHSPLSASLHSPHFLPTGRHIVCPNPTSKLLMSCHRSLGSQDCNAFLVSSGCFVLFQPHKLVMRWTW